LKAISRPTGRDETGIGYEIMTKSQKTTFCHLACLNISLKKNKQK
jgi:hypothetical protein